MELFSVPKIIEYAIKIEPESFDELRLQEKCPVNKIQFRIDHISVSKQTKELL